LPIRQVPVAGSDVRGQKSQQQVQQHRNDQDIIHGAHERKREIDRVERVQGEEHQRWHEPEGPARMDEREPQQVKVFPDHSPEPKQPNHCGILRKHFFGTFLLSKNLTDVMPLAFISIDDTENGRVEVYAALVLGTRFQHQRI
jgi:hypothetical protein